jgi:putative sigma-54 modulation protein
MNIQVQAPFQVNEPLQTLIEERLNKLQKFFDHITTAEVYLRLDGHQPILARDKTVEIQLHVPRQVLYAKENSDSFEKSLAIAIDKMKRQILKYKTTTS